MASRLHQISTLISIRREFWTPRKKPHHSHDDGVKDRDPKSQSVLATLLILNGAVPGTTSNLVDSNGGCERYVPLFKLLQRGAWRLRGKGTWVDSVLHGADGMGLKSEVWSSWGQETKQVRRNEQTERLAQRKVQVETRSLQVSVLLASTELTREKTSEL